jgi:hypothetical protein
MRRLLMTTVAVLALTGAAQAEMFTVPYGVSEGHMNMRTGPGTNHALVGAIPAGQLVNGTRCNTPRDDGITGANWCLVDYAGMRGWVSQAGLMPYAPEPQQPVQMSTQAPHDYPTAVCGQATVVPYEYDTNPVITTEVAYNPESHIWSILHHRQDGSVVARAQQYAIVDSSTGDGVARWEGDLLRNPTLHMVGTMDRNGHYEERIWNKTLRQWVTRIDSDCRLQRPVAASAPVSVPQGTVLQGYPPAGTVYSQDPASAPAECDGPIMRQPAYCAKWIRESAPAAPAPAGGNTIIVVPR